MTKKYNNEIELIDDFCKFLDDNKCEYKREVRKGSYHNEGYFDIVIKKNNLYISVEAKLNQFKHVYQQAARNLVLCNLSYILYPRKPRIKDLSECKKFGVGIIIPNGKSFLYLLKSKEWYIHFQYERIVRNWNENRCGRDIHKKEIPENYDLNKIEKLKCKYEWTK